MLRCTPSAPRCEIPDGGYAPILFAISDAGFVEYPPCDVGWYVPRMARSEALVVPVVGSTLTREAVVSGRDEGAP